MGLEPLIHTKRRMSLESAIAQKGLRLLVREKGALFWAACSRARSGWTCSRSTDDLCPACLIGRGLRGAAGARGARRVWGLRIYRDHEFRLPLDDLENKLKKIMKSIVEKKLMEVKAACLVGERRMIAKDTIGRAHTSGAQLERSPQDI